MWLRQGLDPEPDRVEAGGRHRDGVPVANFLARDDLPRASRAQLAEDLGHDEGMAS